MARKDDDFVVDAFGRTAWGVEAICETFGDLVGLLIREYHGRQLKSGVSPIEALFEITLVFGMHLTVTSRMNPHAVVTVHDSEPPAGPLGVREIALVRQCRVLDWPVDFLLVTGAPDGSQHRAVVECDGHEFHERTKEQAERDRSRDRRLQSEGIRVFRFTGSELHRNAPLRVFEVVQWARRVWGVA